MDVERNIKQATSDVDAFLSTGGYVADAEPAVQHVAAPKATWADFRAHFGKWENGKVLFGCAWSWFALDVAFYGLGLNSSIILSAIGYGSVTTGTPQYIRYQSLYNLSVGNLIITVAGLIPGFWGAFLLIGKFSLLFSSSYLDLYADTRYCRPTDKVGRKPLQLFGFVMLTILLCCMGFGYHKLKDNAVGAFVFLYCVRSPCRSPTERVKD
jgi:PHS family inorganic phosphate transporter-like MFS transporter